MAERGGSLRGDGRGIDPGGYNGAEWLASLYWQGRDATGVLTSVMPDPGVFICPSSPDTNNMGADLGTYTADPRTFGSQTVSYAGMHYRSLTDAAGRPTDGAIRDDFPPNMIMAWDRKPFVMGKRSVLFFDSHVEFRTNTEIDLAPHHQLRQFVLIHLTREHRRHGPSSTQDHDPIGDLQDLLQFVGDEDN